MKNLLLSIFLSFLAFGANARADDQDNLLPVEQAFQVTAKAIDRTAVELDFKIAPDYYLYRGRIKTKAADANTTLGELKLPDGEKKHDEFLGDVEVYHHDFTATQQVSAASGASEVALELRYQGCHQVDPKICFPPQKKVLHIALPPAASGNTASSSLAAALGTTPGSSLLDHGPLPPDQAFVFETIATAPDSLLARFTMPKGYYLYRDKTHFSVPTASGMQLGTPQFPAGKSHPDENFGATTVYYDQVEIPIALIRKTTAAQTLAVTANFQGCKQGSVCYPVMTRTVTVPIPAGYGSTSAAAASTQDDANSADANSDSRFKTALNGSLWLVFGVFFLAGLGLAFTPCVFPMIPILSGIIAGAGENISTRRAIVLSLVYILANAVIFTIAGVIAGLAGKNLQAAFQTAWVLWCFAGLFVVHGAGHVRLLRIAVAQFLAGEDRQRQQQAIRWFIDWRGDHGRAVGIDRRPVRYSAAGRCNSLHRAKTRCPAGRLCLVHTGDGHGCAAGGVRCQRRKTAATRGRMDGCGQGRVRRDLPGAGDLDAVAHTRRGSGSC